MKTCTSVSGGKTSSYLAANYPTDYCVFALVRVEDEECRFKDEKVRRMVEDRLQTDFIGTVEDDTIIYTMLDLEQFLGRPIQWVTGETFESVIYNRRPGSVYLPNIVSRFCTTEMKLRPIFKWWHHFIGEPIEQNIGYRSTPKEIERANGMLEKLNNNGLLEFKETFEKHPNGRRKWVNIEWQRPRFRLIEEGIKKPQIVNFWEGKPVRFAEYNNCAGCFHRSPPFLKMMFKKQPNKMQWFKKQEEKTANQWRSDMSYTSIEKAFGQHELFPSDFSECDSGYCEIN